VIACKRSKIVGVAGGDDRASEPHGGGDHRRVDRVRGIQLISAEQSAGDARRAMVELDNSIASTDDPINAGVARRASVDLHQHGGGNANEGVAPGCLVEHGLGSSSSHRAILS
jgi:hypothetical protein